VLRGERAPCNAWTWCVVGWEIIDPLLLRPYGLPRTPPGRWLRAMRPSTWFEPPGMLPFWAITRYEDCGAILRDHRRFVIAPRLGVSPEEQAPSDAPPFRHLLNMTHPSTAATATAEQQFRRRRSSASGGGRRDVDETLARVADRAQVTSSRRSPPSSPRGDRRDARHPARGLASTLFHLSNTLLGGRRPRVPAGRRSPRRRAGASRSSSSTSASPALGGVEPRDRFHHRPRQRGGGRASPSPSGSCSRTYVLLIVAGNETTRNATSGACSH